MRDHMTTHPQLVSSLDFGDHNGATMYIMHLHITNMQLNGQDGCDTSKPLDMMSFICLQLKQSA